VHVFANPPTEPSFSPEASGPEVPEPSEEEPDVPVATLSGQASTSGGFHFMQESELDNAGLADSQEWVDVSQTRGQVTEVGDATTTAETPQSEETSADETATVVQQGEVIGMVSVFSSPPLDYCFRRHRYRPLETLTGPRMTKAGSHPSLDCKPNLGHLGRHLPQTHHRISQTRVQPR